MPYLNRPSGPHQIANWLIQHGYSVKVIDFCRELTTSDLVSITKKYIAKDTIAVGVSSTFWGVVGDMSEIPKDYHIRSTRQEPAWVTDARAIVEAAYPQLNWVLGGANSELRHALHWDSFGGHPEDIFLKYLDEKASRVRHVPEFSIQTHSGAYMDGLGITKHEVLGMEWGRGCQFSCKFCGYRLLGKKKNTYLRDWGIIKNDLIANYEKYGTTRYIFVDDTVNESTEKIIAMAEIAQSLPFELEWVGYGRLDLIGANKSTVRILKDSGLRSMFFGIESFSPEASTFIDKKWNGTRGKEFLLELKNLWGDDINFHINFMVGLPGDTEDTLDETHQWCQDNNIAAWRFVPLFLSKINTQYGSEFDKNYSKYGFTFPDPMRHLEWSSPTWTFERAVKKAAQLQRDIQARPAVFNLAGFAGLGYSMRELMPLMVHEIRRSSMRDEFMIRYSSAIQEYVNYQLNVAPAY